MGWIYFNGRFSADMRDKKVHCNIFTVHEVVYNISDFLRHPLAIEVEVVLQREEGGGKVVEVWFILYSTSTGLYLVQESCSS